MFPKDVPSWESCGSLCKEHPCWEIEWQSLSWAARTIPYLQEEHQLHAQNHQKLQVFGQPGAGHGRGRQGGGAEGSPC